MRKRKNVNVSIVVPVRNNEEMIGECILSLLNQDFPKEEFEIIVVDNNSTDKTSEVIKKYPVRYVFEEKIGRSSARNTGIRHALGEIIAFTDSDCVADRHWLKELTQGFIREEIGGVGGEILAYHPSSLVERYSEAADILSQRWAFKKRGTEPGFIQTANAAYRRDVLLKVGLFDENLFSCVDSDLAWRVQWVGYRIVMKPDAKVYHRHRNTVGALFYQFFRYGSNKAFVFKKHKKKLNKRWRINFDLYIGLLYNTLSIVPLLFFGKTRFEKIMPLLEMVKITGLIVGGFYGSIKHRVIAI